MKKTKAVKPTSPGADCSTASISELIVLSEIREVIGCGARPMQDELVAIIRNLVKTNNRMKKTIRWALGEVGEFPPMEEGQSPYYWRKELRKRAGL